MVKRRINKPRIMLIFLSVLFIIIFIIILNIDWKKTDYLNEPEGMNSSGFKEGIKIDLLGYEYPQFNDSEFATPVFNDKIKLIKGQIININDNNVSCNFNISIDETYITNYSKSVTAHSTSTFKIPLEIPYGNSQISLSYFCK